MSIDLEQLTDAGRRYIKKMDLEDMAALKICLLATGTLAGLSLKSRFARRLAGVSCSFLAAGLAVPLVSQFLDELDRTPAPAAGRGGLSASPRFQTVEKGPLSYDSGPFLRFLLGF